MASAKVQFIVLFVIFLQLLDSGKTAPQFFGFFDATTAATTVAGGDPITTPKANGGFFGVTFPTITMPNITLPNITSIVDSILPKPRTFWQKIGDQFVKIFDIIKMEVMQIFLSKSLPAVPAAS